MNLDILRATRLYLKMTFDLHQGTQLSFSQLHVSRIFYALVKLHALAIQCTLLRYEVKLVKS